MSINPMVKTKPMRPSLIDGVDKINEVITEVNSIRLIADKAPQNIGYTTKSEIYTQNDHYVALIITDSAGVEHIIAFNQNGIHLEERKNGVTTTIFENH